MIKTFGRLVVEVVGDNSYLLVWDFKINMDGRKFCVPEGFITDFASIPRPLRPFVTGHGKSRKPAVLHDYLYRTGFASTRKAADLIFYAALKANGLSRWKAWSLYAGVRAGGHWSYNG